MLKMKPFAFLLPAIVLIACTNSATSNSYLQKKALTIKKLISTRQILLTNEANFNDHTALNGASAFLIHYKAGIYAVTAKHLLGEAGGVDPEIKPNDLATYLTSWKLFSRVSSSDSADTVTIKKTAFNYTSSPSDMLLLETDNYKGQYHVLTPTFKLPKENDPLFIIGCPYSEVDCKQNLYSATYVDYDTESHSIICAFNETVDLSGFSGAPIIDLNGNVIALLTGEVDSDGKHFVLGTFIKEIEKITR